MIQEKNEKTSLVVLGIIMKTKKIRDVREF